MTTLGGTRSRVYTGSSLRDLIERRTGDEVLARDAALVASVLPFKVNTHAVDELVDWSRAPDDPLYRLLFPHRDMLAPADFDRLDKAAADPAGLRAAVAEIRAGMNPHPAGQLELNTPVRGLQHKYERTLLVFPRQGQTCHSYCGYCFRWAQFIGEPDLRMAVDGPETMTSYLDHHPAVSDVVLTGGDPLVMQTPLLERYVRPLLDPRYEHVESIRIGTKAVSFQPDRITAGPDADSLLRLFEDVVHAGRHLALMLHVSHPRELRTDGARKALARLRGTGAVLRSQAPVIRRVNDDPLVWADLWREQVRRDVLPYYLFVERDTGANHYFGVPLVRVHEIYRDALTRVSGLARTARGPVMSVSPGKVVVDGVADLPGGRAFALRFLQARDPRLVGRPFYARFRADAAGWADLEPYGLADHEFFDAHGGTT
ncbi:lysine 2,3-aminomutase [Amycolatopsis sp. NPDC051061]|uniref:KamA family radical SAM protein n=1 Tax=Amycolatopsis sp. NPDC051061 TaxID=3155042 RepID=UPI0034328F0D